MKHFKKKPVLIIGLTLVSVFLIALISFLAINYYVLKSSSPYILSVDEAGKLENADCIMVLGRRIDKNGQPSLLLNDRLQKGIELYENDVAPRLLMSGGHGRTRYSGIQTMKSLAVASGIPSSHVFMDHAGFTTYESMFRAEDIFNVKKVIIVTQDYHLPRAIYTERALGIDAYGVATRPDTYHGHAKRESKEAFLRYRDFFTVLFRPDPKRLGDKIPITGNGNITNTH